MILLVLARQEGKTQAYKDEIKFLKKNEDCVYCERLIKERIKKLKQKIKGEK